jgi:hypothetical protein
MKFLSSVKKELILATRSFYFYIELLFAAVLLIILLFVIPEHISVQQDQYVYLDMPEPVADYVVSAMLLEDTDGKTESATISSGNEEYSAILITKEDAKVYLLDNEQDVIDLADTKRNVGVVVSVSDDGQLYYEYYLQGYETQRLKNLLSILHNADSEMLELRFDEQEVRLLKKEQEPLNDKENTIPPMLAFNCCLMGMFVMAAYVFLDKKEGVINAYAVTASSVSQYLLSKITVVLLTSTASCLITVVPVLGLGINYALIMLLLLSSAFFSTVLGLLIASFYKDISQAFGTIFFVFILMVAPCISYLMPSWDPLWVRFVPSYPIIQGFREVIISNGDKAYVLIASIGFIAVGLILFFITRIRFKKTLNI